MSHQKVKKGLCHMGHQMGHQKVKRHCAFWAEKGLPYGKSSIKMYLKRQPKRERKSPFIRGFRPFFDRGIKK